MRILAVLLLFPLTYVSAATAPGCADLSKYLQGYEIDLHRKTLKACPNVDYKTITQGVTTIVDQEFLKDRVCLDFTAIETQLQNARLQLAVLNGIDKLKTTVAAHKEKTEKTGQQVPARSFVASLNTAQSLEVLLASRTDKKPFILALREVPENPGFTPQMDLSRRIQTLCKGLPKEGACDPKLFSPNQEAAEEIMGLVKQTKEPTDNEVEQWKAKLAIKRKTPKEDEEAYTFTQMKAELESAAGKLDSKEILTKAEIAAIQKLDDFEDLDGPSIVADLNIAKNQKQARIASDKFYHLMGDAKLRQQYEVQSMFSITWEEVKAKVPDLSADEMMKCNASKEIYSEAVNCINLLESRVSKMEPGLEKSKLEKVLPNLRVSIDYTKSLEEQETVCKNEIAQKDVVTEACWQKLDRDRAKLQDQIFQLNILKERLGFENQDLMKFRNFALQKFKDVKQGCNVVASTIEYCEDESVLSKDSALTLTSHMQIAIMLDQSTQAKSKAEEEAKALCDDSERKTNEIEEKLCAFFDDTTSNVIKTDNVPKVTPPVEAPEDDREKIAKRDAILGGLGNIMGTVINGLYPPQGTNTNLINPYPYNFTPYNAGNPPMGIADGIMFNARAYGAYGFYQPTPGYTPGTAFGFSGMSAYKPVSSPSTKYFTYK
jgi:hypothetical protein